MPGSSDDQPRRHDHTSQLAANAVCNLIGGLSRHVAVLAQAVDHARQERHGFEKPLARSVVFGVIIVDVSPRTKARGRRHEGSEL